MNIKKAVGIGLITAVTALNSGVYFAEEITITDSAGNSKKIEITEVMQYQELTSGFEGMCVSELPEDAPCIKVIPSKNSVKVGEEFYVDFVISNNPGFKDYSFEVSYLDLDSYSQVTYPIIPVKGDEEEMNSAAEVLLKNSEKRIPLIDAKLVNDGISKSIKNKKINGFEFKGKVTSEIVNSDGTLFRAKFKAVKAGKAAIRIEPGFINREFYMIRDSNFKNIPIYSQGARVTIEQ